MHGLVVERKVKGTRNSGGCRGGEASEEEEVTVEEEEEIIGQER